MNKFFMRAGLLASFIVIAASFAACGRPPIELPIEDYQPAISQGVSNLPVFSVSYNDEPVQYLELPVGSINETTAVSSTDLTPLAVAANQLYYASINFDSPPESISAYMIGADGRQVIAPGFDGQQVQIPAEAGDYTFIIEAKNGEELTFYAYNVTVQQDPASEETEIKHKLEQYYTAYGAANFEKANAFYIEEGPFDEKNMKDDEKALFEAFDNLEITHIAVSVADAAAYVDYTLTLKEGFKTTGYLHAGKNNLYDKVDLAKGEDNEWKIKALTPLDDELSYYFSPLALVGLADEMWDMTEHLPAPDKLVDFALCISYRHADTANGKYWDAASQMYAFPAQEIEKLVTTYFDVKPTHIQKAEAYDPAGNVYKTPGWTAKQNSVYALDKLDVKKDGSVMTISVYAQPGFNPEKDDPVAAITLNFKGDAAQFSYVSLQIEQKPEI